MVQKIILFILLLLIFAHASHAGFVLHWPKHQSSSCQKLIDIFLSEFRQLAPEQTIEINLMEPNVAATPFSYSENQTHFSIECLTQGVGLTHDNSKYSFRYLEKAKGFDANDWLVFQRRFLRPAVQKSDLAVPQKENVFFSSTTNQDFQPNLTSTELIFKKWWFWGSVVTIGVGSFVLLKKNNESAVHVEIR